MTVTCVLGIDIGSATSKGVLLNRGEVLASHTCPSGGDFQSAAEKIRQSLFDAAGISSSGIGRTVATGYGSQQVAYADEVKTEISCHARGVFHLLPSVRTVIDVGDLYSKVFRVDGEGNVVQFVLSGKCAGGSGRLLQIIARVLQLKVEEIGEISLRSKKRVDFSTGCVVFAESEAVSRIAEGATREDLLAGIHHALGSQLNSLAERVTIDMDIAMVGGGAKDIGLVKAMEEIRGHRVLVPADPLITAALGAALFAEGS
ncbi:MAG: 2-hydroxyglutaryl-CoA dehydratase [Desulfobacteraceae bacterium]|nr:MAG: 2-hydroxyglutaryl-CoA dehydratase [Desulfobacteraceae bacterium]